MRHFGSGPLPAALPVLGLALLLHQQIRARKFFRVAFLLPFMISPIAIGWMIGKAMFDARFGPFAKVARELDITLSFYDTGSKAVFWLIVISAWYAWPRCIHSFGLLGSFCRPVAVIVSACSSQSFFSLSRFDR